MRTRAYMAISTETVVDGENISTNHMGKNQNNNFLNSLTIIKMYHLFGGKSRFLGLSAQLLIKCINTVPACSLGSYSTTKVLQLKRQPKEEITVIQKKNAGSKFNESDINFASLDPDKFGDLYEQYGRPAAKTVRAAPLKAEEEKDDKDGYDKLEIKGGIKRSPAAYIRMMNELKKQKPLDVARIMELHQQYVYEDRYIPDDTRLYSLLLDVCGKAGFTRKAVELYEEMTMFQLKPTKSAITALFNACSNCPPDLKATEYARKQTLRLREKLQLEGYEFNDIQYNVIIKAFARLGDLENARTTMQEMKEKGRDLSLDTYAMMLMGCIGSRSSGLLEATRLLHQMLANNVQLELPVVNLFLRCIRDCDLNKDDLHQIASSPLIAAKQQQLIGEANNSASAQLASSNASSGHELLNVKSSSELPNPNLLTGSNLHQIVAIDYDSLSRPANRFLIFGGVPGFTALLDANNIKPTLKTITLFIDLMDKAEESLDEVKRLLKQYNLKADVYLYNVLLKKAAKTGNRDLVRTILKSMQTEDHIQPDIMTFGALTFSCNSDKSAKRLLSDMYNCGVAPNEKILGSMVNIACSQENLEYVRFMLEYMEVNQLPLSRLDIEQIDLLLKKVRQEIATNERQDVAVSEEYKKNYEKAAYIFRSRLKSSTVQLNVNPWTQFEPGQMRRTSGKAKYNAFVKGMKQKMDIKHKRDTRPKIVDYNDEIDD